jgi:hypothetical protein
MAKKSADKILSGSELAIATAEKVFGWKSVHKHEGGLIGKKQDSLGAGEQRRCLITPTILFRHTR